MLSYFKARPLIEAHNVAVFSSNYTLYASMSARFAAVVESLSSRVEQYSIDELFVDCRGMETAMNLEAFGHQLRREVQRHTTLTVEWASVLPKRWQNCVITPPRPGQPPGAWLP
ncbi:DNA polymerase IV [Klebsiella pneumoniae]|nr:DNA polymerase IV [Klebsiella pneumoniae]